MSPFDTFIQQAWNDHAADSAGVAARLSTEGWVQLSSAAELPALAHLAHHVLGQHLGHWDDGMAFQQRLAESPWCDDAGRAAVQRYLHSLALSAGRSDPRTGMNPADHVRVSALAAATLALHDTPRAAALLQQALAQADDPPLPDSDPAVRALAVAANNLAGTLEEQPERTADQRALMILAAQSARRLWARAGTWLETERAEYRLAMTWLQAGDATRARHHAQACLQIVQDHDAPPLEHFFAHEALALAERAAGRDAARALAQAQQAFDALSADDQAGCRETLGKLRA
jgi:hypothetical protein